MPSTTKRTRNQYAPRGVVIPTSAYVVSISTPSYPCEKTGRAGLDADHGTQRRKLRKAAGGQGTDDHGRLSQELADRGHVLAIPADVLCLHDTHHAATVQVVEDVG